MHRFFTFLIFICLSYCLSQSGFGQDFHPTTFYVVRHADRDGTNDALTQAGEKRAEQLAVLMKALRVDAIFSTDTQRTQLTAKPTADALGIEVISYGQLDDAWFEKIKAEHQGKVVLIVGHSNTSGQIVNGLGGKGDFSLEENEYDNLFIVTTTEQGATAIRVDFGEPDNQ